MPFIIVSTIVKYYLSRHETCLAGPSSVREYLLKDNVIVNTYICSTGSFMFESLTTLKSLGCLIIVVPAQLDDSAA